MPINQVIRWNMTLIVAVGAYGFITNEPYWRDTGHGPWLYDYLFWFGLFLNGPSGLIADYLAWFGLSDAEPRFVIQYFLWCLLLWPQWRLYHALALWCGANRARQLGLYGAAFVLTILGSVAAYQAWIFGHRPSHTFIDPYFWFVRVAGLGCAGVVLLAYTYVVTSRLRSNYAFENGHAQGGRAVQRKC